MSSPAFGASDLARAERAIRTLLSPLDYPTLDAWRRQATRDIEALVGADISAFVLPSLGGAEPVFSEEPPPLSTGYFEASAQAFGEFRVPERFAQQRVSVHREILADEWAAYNRTPYVHEFLRPIRCFDGVTLTGPPRGTPSMQVMPHLHLHKSRPEERFSRKDAALLRLVYPAFEAGIATLRRMRTRREELLRTLDALGEGALLAGARGRILHTNAAMRALGAGDPEMPRVEAAMQHLAQDYLMQDRFKRSRRVGGFREDEWTRLALPSPGVLPEREVATAAARYCLRATLLGEDLMGRAPAVLVTAERLTAQLPSEEALRERFELTARQAQVALLVAEGMTDKGIAERLGIRVHTARNHTRRVLEKLGVGSRAAVRPAMTR